MRPTFSKLVQVKNEHMISRETDEAFWILFQRSLLLALREQGSLNEAQCSYALELMDQAKKK